MRLFIGLPLDEEGKRGVRYVVESLQRKRWKVRWEPEEKWHVTVAFMGTVQTAQMGRLKKILRRSGVSHNARSAQDDSLALDRLASESRAMEIWFKGVGTFPRQEMAQKYGERWHGRYMRRLKLRQKPTVVLPTLIYVRLGGDIKAMHRLVTEVRMQLTAAEIEFDQKPFVPHLTIGRIAKDCGRAERIEIGKTVGKLYEMDIPRRWVVGRVRLYASELFSEGSRYQTIDEVKLARQIQDL